MCRRAHGDVCLCVRRTMCWHAKQNPVSASARGSRCGRSAQRPATRTRHRPAPRSPARGLCQEPRRHLRPLPPLQVPSSPLARFAAATTLLAATHLHTRSERHLIFASGGVPYFFALGCRSGMADHRNVPIISCNLSSLAVHPQKLLGLVRDGQASALASTGAAVRRVLHRTDWEPPPPPAVLLPPPAVVRSAAAAAGGEGSGLTAQVVRARSVSECFVEGRQAAGVQAHLQVRVPVRRAAVTTSSRISAAFRVWALTLADAECCCGSTGVPAGCCRGCRHRRRLALVQSGAQKG